jgi:O-antigen/teichoic acid export membrane protein
VALGRRIAVTSSAQIVQVVISAVGLILLARVTTARDFGLVVLLNSAVAMAAVLLTAGIQSSLVVIAAQSSERRQLHGQVLIITLIVALLSLALVPFASAVAELPLGSGLTAPIVVLTIARIAPTVYCSLQTALLMGSGRVTQMSAVNIVGSAVSLAGAVGAFTFADEPLLGAVIGLAVGSAGWSAFTAVASLATVGVGWRAAPGAWSRLGRIGLPVHVGSIAYWLMLRADLFLLGALAPGAMVGRYAFALSVAERVSVISAPVYAAAAADLSGSVRSTAVLTAVRLVRVHAAIAVVVFVVSLFFGNEILSLLGGSQYGGAGLEFALLALGNAILSIWSLLSLSLISQHGAAWTTAVLQVLGAGLGLVMYVSLIPAYGGVGAAIASAVTYLVLTGAAAVVFARRAGLRLTDLVARPSHARDLWEAAAARRHPR